MYIVHVLIQKRTSQNCNWIYFYFFSIAVVTLLPPLQMSEQVYESATAFTSISLYKWMDNIQFSLIRMVINVTFCSFCILNYGQFATYHSQFKCNFDSTWFQKSCTPKLNPINISPEWPWCPAPHQYRLTLGPTSCSVVWNEINMEKLARTHYFLNARCLYIIRIS